MDTGLRHTGIAALGGILFGYGIGVMSGVLEMTEFKDHFSYNDVTKGFIVSTFLITAAQTLAAIFAGRVFSGLAAGATMALVPLYIAELASEHNRGQLMTLNQLGMTGGILLSFWVNYGLWAVRHGWRISLGLQLLPALLLLAGTYTMPYSPRWLIKRGREDEAQDTLRALRGLTETRGEFQEIKRTVRHEEVTGSDHWQQLFRGEPLKRLLLGVFVSSAQQWTGINVLMSYGPSLFRSMGFHHGSLKLLLQAMLGLVNFGSTFFTLLTVDRLGRRPLLLFGAAAMAVCMMVLCVLGEEYGSVREGKEHEHLYISNRTVGLACMVAVYVYVAVFATTWGPVAWIMPCELFPLGQRARGVAITTSINFAWSVLVTQFAPQLLSAIQFYMFLVFFVLLGINLIITANFVPETRGLSLEKLVDPNAFRRVLVCDPLDDDFHADVADDRSDEWAHLLNDQKERMGIVYQDYSRALHSIYH